MIARDWDGGKVDYKVDPGTFLWLMELFHILIVTDDCSQNPQYYTLKRLNFTVCKLSLDIFNGEKKGRFQQLVGH